MQNKKIVLNKAAAIAWVVAGIMSFPLGWAYTIWFVVICSIWANVYSSWATAEAADDREMKDLLIHILEVQGNGNHRYDSCNRCSRLLRGGDVSGSDEV